MEEELQKLLDERVGEGWRRWGVQGLLRHVYEVAYLAEGDQDTWTTTTARLVGIYKSEQNRIRRVEDWNREQARKRRADG